MHPSSLSSTLDSTPSPHRYSAGELFSNNHNPPRSSSPRTHPPLSPALFPDLPGAYSYRVFGPSHPFRQLAHPYIFHRALDIVDEPESASGNRMHSLRSHVPISRDHPAFIVKSTAELRSRSLLQSADDPTNLLPFIISL